MPYLNSMFGFSYGYILAPTQNPAQHPEKICEKVAETAEIPKTAPKTQLKSRKKSEKSLKQLPTPACFLYLHRAILLTQCETLSAHNCEGTEQLHKI